MHRPVVAVSCVLPCALLTATVALAAPAAKSAVATPAAKGAVAGPAGKVAPPDIQSTFFTGQPFTSATPQNIKYKMVFAPEGTMTREPLGKTGVKGDGIWKLSKDGFCTTWKGSPSNCFTLISAGDNKWSVLKGMSVIGTWSK